MAEQSRTEQRMQFTPEGRLALLEQDADKAEAKMRDMFAMLDRIEDKQSNIFIALVVGAIGLAINVAVMLTITGVSDSVKP